MKPNQTQKSRLNSCQRKFLRLMSDEVLTPEELLAKCDITGHDFHQWMQRDAFRRELSRTMRAMGQRCDVDIAIGAKVGSRTLAQQAKYGADGNLRRLASVNLIGLNIQRRFSKRRGSGKRKASEPSGPAMQELPPDLPLEEAERLFAILESDSPEAAPSDTPGEGDSAASAPSPA